MSQCCHAVQILKMVMRWRQCKNKGIVKRNGEWYCGVHDPEKVNERLDKLEERRKKIREQQRKIHIAYLSLKQKE